MLSGYPFSSVAVKLQPWYIKYSRYGEKIVTGIPIKTNCNDFPGGLLKIRYQ